ncbi:hypothetical protein [Desulfoscipio gibsoniae]|uniref:Uncharacterized protein n=1 Tax=Desulfoscipio gibsoniae DSM 7213 TaxID=767817 RepID=R4KDB9_9FIRM|nr:hypothetical protein [Desulfoscipio gibsoniae]AGL00569.1 hypothetical protein Desgi_1037 [Desulfoscipio gibsoniae DSM 7213]
MSRNAVYTIVFFLVIGLVGLSYWVVYSFMPWLIRDVEEMSPKQLEVTKRHLAGNGIALSTDRNEYVPGDTVLLTITNHTKIELEHQPGGFHFRIDILRARTESEAFSISPGDSKTVSLKIPKTADPGQYIVLASYQHIDWAPGGNDLIISAPKKQIKVLGSPPPPVPREGRVEMVNDHKAEVYLGEKTYVEAVMGSTPLELQFHLPEGVGYARIEGTSLNSYENHAEYLYFKMKDGQPVSGSNVPPKIPARVSFKMDLDRDAADSYGLLMRYQDWVADKKPLLFKIVIEMDVVY